MWLFAQFSIQRSDQPWIVLEPTTTCLTSQLLSLDKARSTCLERENMFGPHLCQWIQTGAFLQSMYLSLQFPCVIMPPPLLSCFVNQRSRCHLQRSSPWPFSQHCDVMCLSSANTYLPGCRSPRSPSIKLYPFPHSSTIRLWSCPPDCGGTSRPVRPNCGETSRLVHAIWVV